MIFYIPILITILLLIIFVQHRNKLIKKKISEDVQKKWGSKYIKDEVPLNYIDKYFKLQISKTENNYYQIISNDISKDLSLDNVFNSIDRTISGIGQQYLYYKFRVIQKINSNREFNSLTDKFLTNKDEAIQSQIILSRLANKHELVSLLNEEEITKPKYLSLIYFSTICVCLIIGISIYNPLFLIALLPFFVINFGFHYKNKWQILDLSNSINQLTTSFQVAKKLETIPIINNHFRKKSFLNTISVIAKKSFFITKTSHFSNDLNIVVWLFFELIKILSNFESIVLFNIIASLNKEKKAIHSLFVFIGEVDSALSIASLKYENTAVCIPEFNQDNKLNIEDLIHPLVTNYIPNNLKLNENSVLITGSNMSGKTTFIRSVAINSILAQNFNFCFATKYNAPYYKISSSIQNADNVLEKTSFFFQEVKRLKTIVDNSKSNDNYLFIIDEIFKGTNTKERILGAYSILKYINKKHHTVLITTHDTELADQLENNNYSSYYFQEEVNEKQLTFDYLIKKGKLLNGNALQILKLNDFPIEILTDCKLK